jgi:predicted acyltransferase
VQTAASSSPSRITACSLPNALTNQVCVSPLFLTIVGLSLPCAAGVLHNFTYTEQLIFPRIIAVPLLLVYLSYVYVQLIPHIDMFTGNSIAH